MPTPTGSSSISYPISPKRIENENLGPSSPKRQRQAERINQAVLGKSSSQPCVDDPAFSIERRPSDLNALHQTLDVLSRSAVESVQANSPASSQLEENHLNENNVGIILKNALEHRSNEELQRCFTFLQEQTNITFTCKDFESVVINIEGNHNDTNIARLQTFLPSLKNALGNQIQIAMHLGPLQYSQIFTNFVAQNRSLIYVLSLLEVDENTLQFLLRGTTNLHKLSIKSNQISSHDIAMQELNKPGNLVNLKQLTISSNQMVEPPQIGRLKTLKSLKIKCDHMVSPPNLLHLTKLKQLVISSNAMTEPPDLFPVRGSLDTLCIIQCNSMKNPPRVIECRKLLILQISDCHAMTEPPKVLERQETRSMVSGRSITRKKRQQQEKPKNALKNLAALVISNCPNMSGTLDVEGINSLKNFQFNGDKMEVSDLEAFKSTYELSRFLSPFVLYEFFQTQTVHNFEKFKRLYPKVLTSYMFTPLERFREEPIIRALLQKYSAEIFQTRHEKLVDIINTLYPPNVAGNSSLYPLIIHWIEGIDGEASEIGIFTTLHQPIEAPSLILQNLSEQIGPSHIPRFIRVIFGGEEGADGGALARQLFGALSKGLVVENNGNTQFEKRQNGFYLPNLKETLNISEKEILEFYQLGKILAFLLDCHQYPIGQVFDSHFFEMLVCMEDEDVAMTPQAYQHKLEQLDFESFHQLCSPIIEQTPEQLNRIEIARSLSTIHHFNHLTQEHLNYFAALGIDINEANFTEEKKNFLGGIQGFYLNSFVAIQAIARGLKDCLPIQLQTEHGIVINDWNALKFVSGKDIEKLVQGAFSKEDFRAALEVSDGTSSQHLEKAKQFKKWLSKWIEQANDEELKGLLIALTGSPGMLAGEKIQLMVHELFTEIKPRTCIKEIQIPPDESKENFKAEIENLSKIGLTASFNAM